MVPTRWLLSVSVLFLLGSVPVAAGPTSHAMESDDDSILFVDLERGRLLRLRGNELSVVAELDAVPAGDAMQNLVHSVDGETYIGQKKTVFLIGADGTLEPSKPPSSLKPLFSNRPGDLAPDGSVYVAKDFRNIQRSLPGGDAHPVLATNVISKIHSMAVTPYGRVFFANNSEIAKLDAQGEVEILQELEDEQVFGMVALGENSVLVLRRSASEPDRIERLDALGNSEVVVTAEQIAAVSREASVEIASASN